MLIIGECSLSLQQVSEQIPNIGSFMGGKRECRLVAYRVLILPNVNVEYKMNCKAAANRLIAKGVPATTEVGCSGYHPIGPNVRFSFVCYLLCHSHLPCAIRLLSARWCFWTECRRSISRVPHGAALHYSDGLFEAKHASQRRGELTVVRGFTSGVGTDDAVLH